jgi:hypothetical protein
MEDRVAWVAQHVAAHFGLHDVGGVSTQLQCAANQAAVSAFLDSDAPLLLVTCGVTEGEGGATAARPVSASNRPDYATSVPGDTDMAMAFVKTTQGPVNHRAGVSPSVTTIGLAGSAARTLQHALRHAFIPLLGTTPVGRSQVTSRLQALLGELEEGLNEAVAETARCAGPDGVAAILSPEDEVHTLWTSFLCVAGATPV